MADETLYRQLILSPGYDTKTGVFGLVCSADNGQTFKVYWTPYGRVWYPEDAKSFFPQLWPLIEQKLKDSGMIEGAVTVTWDQVQNKPELVTEEQLTDKLKGYLPVNGSITWDHITGKPDLATQDDLKKIELTPGPPGKDGSPGRDGKSAYQIAVDNGFVGSEAEWLQSLHGKDGAATSGGDASLSIEAITDLIKQHIHATVDTTNGQLTVSTDDVSNGSIADTVAAKVVSSMSWKLSTDGELIAEVGGE